MDIMIDLAEKRLARDHRVRTLATATFSVDADDETAPSGFRALVSVVHDGPTYYGPLEVVGTDILPTLKAKFGLTGPPAYCAVLNASGTFTFKFAPVPDATYALKAVYWRTLTALSSGANWLVTSHPDIYLYAALCESAPYLKDDSRLAMWETELESRLGALHNETQAQLFSGPMRRQFTPIG